MKRIVMIALLVTCVASVVRAEAPLKVDPVHSSFLFRTLHANIGHIWGRFSDYGGTFTIDESDPSKSSFDLFANPLSIDTTQKQRDDHLQRADYFNSKVFPKITFKSTSVKKLSDNKLEAIGDLTVHGVTKSITVPIEIVGKGEFPKGTFRYGIEATFTIKMSDYKIQGDPKSVADEVLIIASLEGMRK